MGSSFAHVQIKTTAPQIMRMLPGIDRSPSSHSISKRAFRLVDSRASLVSSLMRRVGRAEARSDASFTALWRRNAPTPIVATAAARATARAINVLACVTKDPDMTDAPETEPGELPAAETAYAHSAEEADRRSRKYRSENIDLIHFPRFHRRFCLPSISKLTFGRQA